MDGIKCLESFNKMCDSYESCEDCELNAIRTSFTSCRELLTDNPKEIVPIIERWSKGLPKKTRQDELLEHYPNALKGIKVISVCPRNLGLIDRCPSSNCDKCQEGYWLAEVEA